MIHAIDLFQPLTIVRVGNEIQINDFQQVDASNLVQVDESFHQIFPHCNNINLISGLCDVLT